jgi:hypothetical protein
MPRCSNRKKRTIFSVWHVSSTSEELLYRPTNGSTPIIVLYVWKQANLSLKLGMGFDPHSGQSKVRLFSLTILTDKIVLVVQSCRVPTPPSTGPLVSVCDQPPRLICFGVCGRKAITEPTNPTLKLNGHPGVQREVKWDIKKSTFL